MIQSHFAHLTTAHPHAGHSFNGRRIAGLEALGFEAICLMAYRPDKATEHVRVHFGAKVGCTVGELDRTLMVTQSTHSVRDEVSPQLASHKGQL